MPEGDSVWLARERLHEALAGAVLTGFDLRVPRYATVDLTGHTITEVACRGKHLLFRMSEGHTLHTHFKLDGMWYLFRPGQRWNGGPGYDIRAILTTENWVAIGYRLHDIAVLPTSQEHRLIGHLGPDIMSPEWDLAEAIQRITSQPDREVGPALLDQRNVAGIGNDYKTESLYLAGITPWTLVRDVPDLAKLLNTAKRLMWTNRYHPERSTTGSSRRGENHWVFERPRRGCLKCGTLVAVAKQGDPPYDRLCYWCPNCQTGPAPKP